MSRILKNYDKSIYQISDHYIKVVFEFDKDVAEFGENATNDGTQAKESSNRFGDMRSIMRMIGL